MPQEKPFIKSQSITDSQISGSQIQQGQAEANLNQAQQDNQADIKDKAPSAVDVVELLEKIEELLRTAKLPEPTKEQAVAYLTTAKKEAEQAEPDKELAAKSLKRMGETLKVASDTVEAGKGLWEKVKPMLAPIAGWLGAARSLMGF